jgi:hypothetical protein
MSLPWGFSRNPPWFRAVFWGVLLYPSHGLWTTSIVGAPVKRDGLSTRTVTLSNAHKTTLAPGDTHYNLVGCYGNTGLDGRGGHPFGQDKDYASPSSVDSNGLTPYTCLSGCYSLKPSHKDKDHFVFAGLRNGR